jgi:S1-C subfamily serine protease
MKGNASASARLKAVQAAVCVVVAMLIAALGVFAPYTSQPKALADDSSNSASNQNVLNDRAGVYELITYITDKNGQDHPISQGSCFFIDNGTTIITNDHVVDPANPTLNAEYNYDQYFKSLYGDDYLNRRKFEVEVLRDVQFQFTLKQSSPSTDFAILTAANNQPVNQVTALSLGSAKNLAQTQSVWSLGFPDTTASDSEPTITTYTQDDVTIGSGTVQKLQTEDDNQYIINSATISGGNSGGPLVDQNGVVVGINTMMSLSYGGSYNNAISIDFVKTTRDKLGIAYTNGTTSGVVGSANGVDKSSLESLIQQCQNQATDLSQYTDDTAGAYSSALSNAQSVDGNSNASQSDVDNATSTLQNAFNGLQKKPNYLPLIIGIIIAAIVVIAAVIIIILLVRRSNKKKKAAGGQGPQAAMQPDAMQPPMPAGIEPPMYQPQAQPYQPAASDVPVYEPPANVFDEGGDEGTTVLNPDSGETTLLAGSHGAASLTRASNGEKARINKQSFVIGKQRSKVDFVIPDNSAISRQHAKITTHDDKFFITDMGSSNYTYVNGGKIAPNQEVELHPGDQIKLADEEFTFEA